MATASPDPVVDVRPPGYGSTLSFGPVGPSRIVVTVEDAAVGAESMEAGWCLLHVSDNFASTTPFSVWRGRLDGFQMTFSFRCVNRMSGWWEWRLFVGPIGQAQKQAFDGPLVNATWLSSSGILFPADNIWPFAGWTYIKEHRPVADYFPDASYPETF